MDKSVIITWNQYIWYLKEVATNGVKPLGFDEWVKQGESA